MPVVAQLVALVWHVVTCFKLHSFTYLVAQTCDNSCQKIQLLIELVFGLVAQNSTQLVASLFLVGCSHVLHFALVVFPFVLGWLSISLLSWGLTVLMLCSCLHMLFSCTSW